MLARGSLLGPYEVLCEIGAGGMGEVYKAKDTRLDRTVAIKVLRGDVRAHPDRLARLQREARAVAALEHPHICRLYDVGPDYLVMEYLEGVPLHGPVSRDAVVEYSRAILGALEAAHAKGIVHRDLKPANILLTPQGVKLLDFGLATRPSIPSDLTEQQTIDALTQPGIVMGSPAYMAPEQWQGRPADVRTDIYAFGAVLYELLTGHRAGRERAVLPDARLEKVVATCLATDPADRFQSVREVTAALTAATRPPRFLPLALSAAAAIVIMAVIGLLLWQRRPPAAILGDQDVLVLADFDNKTDDSIFDGALRQALAFDLQQSPFLKAMDDEQVRQAVKAMGRPADTRVTTEIAREVCLREGEKATLEGAITRLGTRYLLTLQAVNCKTGETLAREQGEATDKEHVIEALAGITGRLRPRLGEKLPTIEGDQRLYTHRVTTASLEALQQFASADTQWARTGNGLEGIPYYERATQLDPDFGLAWALLAMRTSQVGDTARAKVAIEQALRVADRVSERERLFIERTAAQVRGDTAKILELDEALVRLYPRDPVFHMNLSDGYLERGEWEKGLAEAEAAMRTGPKFITGYREAQEALTALNRVQEAQAVIRRAITEGFDTPALHGSLLYIATAQQDSGAIERELQWFSRYPNEPTPYRQQANAAAALGRYAEAMRLYRRAQAVSQESTNAGSIGRYMTQAVVASALLGRCAENVAANARNKLLIDALCGSSDAVKRYSSNAVSSGPGGYVRGLALLQAGDSESARAWFDEMLRVKISNWGPEYPAAFVGKARAAAAAGDYSAAQDTYREFLAFWKDADPDVPLLMAAQREYAALRKRASSP